MSFQYCEKTVAELAIHVGGQVIGDGSVVIKGLAKLASAVEGDLAFIDDAKRITENPTAASCVIVPEGVTIDAPSAITSKHPKLAFAKIAGILRIPKFRAPGVQPGAVVAATAEIDATAHVAALASVGERTRIGAGSAVLAGASIGNDVVIGRDCVVNPNATLYDDTVLGDRVVIHAGVVLGSDGFGYVREPSGYVKFPQIGRVILGDDVEVGANACIDRGALEDTRIGDGTKIDNLGQIAHNVQIGQRVAISAQVGISGSATLGDDIVMGGQVGIADKAHLESGSIVAAKAGVAPGKVLRKGIWWGSPVRPLEEQKRIHVHLGFLPGMYTELKKLRAQVAELMKKA